jgi:hypothetical protein
MANNSSNEMCCEVSRVILPVGSTFSALRRRGSNARQMRAKLNIAGGQGWAAQRIEVSQFSQSRCRRASHELMGFYKAGDQEGHSIKGNACRKETAHF